MVVPPPPKKKRKKKVSFEWKVPFSTLRLYDLMTSHIFCPLTLCRLSISTCFFKAPFQDEDSVSKADRGGRKVLLSKLTAAAKRKRESDSLKDCSKEARKMLCKMVSSLSTFGLSDF